MGFGAGIPVLRHQQWSCDRMVLPRLSFGVILVAILLALVSGGPPIFVLAAKGHSHHAPAGDHRGTRRISPRPSSSKTPLEAIGTDAAGTGRDLGATLASADYEEVFFGESNEDWTDENDWTLDDDDEEEDGEGEQVDDGWEPLERGSRFAGGKAASTSWRRGSQSSARLSGTSLKDRINVFRRRASYAYREAKSVMSSEMEGVVLKATRPDDGPVKQKHLAALMRPATEMPKEFNVYLPVVRKLWSKMTDKEWRVTAKALHILHRFAAQGSAEHANNLKETVSVLRTHHDSRRKVKYFDMGSIVDVRPPPWSSEDVAPLSRFLRVYGDYVLLRAACFGPNFSEVSNVFAMVLGKAQLLPEVEALLSSGLECVLDESQERAVTVASVMQVAQDLRDVLEVCAAQLELLLTEGNARNLYPDEVERWFDFLRLSHGEVENFVEWANALASRHDVSPLQPLAVTPALLRKRGQELELEEKQEQREACPADAQASTGRSSLAEPDEIDEAMTTMPGAPRVAPPEGTSSQGPRVTDGPTKASVDVGRALDDEVESGSGGHSVTMDCSQSESSHIPPVAEPIASEPGAPGGLPSATPASSEREPGLIRPGDAGEDLVGISNAPEDAQVSKNRDKPPRDADQGGVEGSCGRSEELLTRSSKRTKPPSLAPKSRASAARRADPDLEIREDTGPGTSKERPRYRSDSASSSGHEVKRAPSTKAGASSKKVIGKSLNPDKSRALRQPPHAGAEEGKAAAVDRVKLTKRKRVAAVGEDFGGAMAAAEDSGEMGPNKQRGSHSARRGSVPETLARPASAQRVRTPGRARHKEREDTEDAGGSIARHTAKHEGGSTKSTWTTAYPRARAAKTQSRSSKPQGGQAEDRRKHGEDSRGGGAYEGQRRRLEKSRPKTRKDASADIDR